MGDNPRKISEIRIEIDMTANSFSDSQKKILDHCVKTCPVALSLDKSVFQNVTLLF